MNQAEKAGPSPWPRATLVFASIFVSIATLKYIEDRIALEHALRKMLRIK